MMLEQIERRLAEKAAAMKGKKMREAPPPGSFKTIGIRVDAKTYDALLAFMQERDIKQVKIGAVEAMKNGLSRG